MISIVGNSSPIEFMNFPDGESFIKFDYDGKSMSILWRYENDSELMSIAQIYEIINRKITDDKKAKLHPPLIYLYIPYFPHARQDRPTTDNQPFSLKAFCALLHNIIDFSNTVIYTLDIHSEAISNLPINKYCIDVKSNVYSRLIAKSYDAIVSPDAGATFKVHRWYHDYRTENPTHDVKFIQCAKNRDPSTGQLTDPSFCTADDHRSIIRSGRALIVDDIGTGFGTHIQLGKFIKKTNPDIKLDLFVSHSSFTRGKEPVLEVFDTVYTTDSLIKGLAQVDDRIVRFKCTKFFFSIS